MQCYHKYALIVLITSVTLSSVSFNWNDPVSSENLNEFNRYFEEQIVLVNVGNLDRGGIAKQIEILNKYEPAVIGVDAFFRKPKRGLYALQDSFVVACDSMLAKTLRESKNIVLGLDLTGPNNTIKKSHPIFHPKNVNEGFLDIFTESISTREVKRCFIKQHIPDSISVKYNLANPVLSFAAQLALQYNREKAMVAINRENALENIRFAGNITKVDSSNKVLHNYISFLAYDVDDIFKEKFDPESIKGKIIILGYMGDRLHEYSSTDKYKVRINQIENTEEMYGTVIHANICSMILKGQFDK